jgi:hypothetical protein
LALTALLSVTTYTNSPRRTQWRRELRLLLLSTLRTMDLTMLTTWSFMATVNTATGLSTPPTGKVTSGTGYCSAEQGTQIPCNIPSLPAGTTASVEIDVTPAISTDQPLLSVGVTGVASANNGPLQISTSQTVASWILRCRRRIRRHRHSRRRGLDSGNLLSIESKSRIQRDHHSDSNHFSFDGDGRSLLLSARLRSCFRAPACGNTTLSIPTVARPVNNGSLLRRRSFYAAWLPISRPEPDGAVDWRVGSGREPQAAALAGGSAAWAGCGIDPVAAGLRFFTSTTVTTNGGTSAGIYIITISGAAGTGASHNTQVQLQVI